MIRNLFDQKEITEKKNWKFDYLLKRKNGNFCLMFSRSKFKERSEARGWMAGQIWRNRLQFWREKIIKIMDLMLLLGTANSQFCGPGKFELWRLLQRQFRAIKCHAKKLVRTKRCGVGFIFQKQKSPTYGLCKNLLVEPLQNRGKRSCCCSKIVNQIRYLPLAPGLLPEYVSKRLIIHYGNWGSDR